MSDEGHVELSVTPIRGQVTLIDDIPFWVEDWDMPWNAESIEYVDCDTGQKISFPTAEGAELSARLRGLNAEGRALLTNGTLTTGGNTPHKNEYHVSATQTFTLDNIPVYDGSVKVYRRMGDLENGRINLVLKRVTGTPAAVDEFSYVASTGVITLYTSISDGTKYYVDYLEVQSTSGKKLTHTFDVDASAHLLVIQNGVLNRVDNTFDPDGYSIVYPAVTILTKPPLGGQIGDLKELEAVFTVITPPIESLPK